MCMPLTRRTQLLLDEGRYLRLAARAQESGRSVASIIREAIDEKLAGDIDLRRRAEAGRMLLEAAPPPGDREPDWEDAKREMLRDLYDKEPRLS